MGCYGLGLCGRILAVFHLSGGKKVDVDFLVNVVKTLFSIGVPGVLQKVRVESWMRS